MLHRITLTAIIFTSFIFTACGKEPETDKKITPKVESVKSTKKDAPTPQNSMTEIQQISYILGANWGRSIRVSRQSDPALKALDIKILIQGIHDAIEGKKLKLTPAEIQQVMMSYQAKRIKKLQQAGIDFLASKKKEKDVVTHKSGLLYKIVKAGKGKSPTANDVVLVHYSGTNAEGKEFDSSYRAGRPIPFRLNQMIKGWKIAIPLMKEGAKWTLYIPHNLAYGPRGRPPKIGPYQVLVFNIELIKVNPEAKKPETKKPDTNKTESKKTETKKPDTQKTETKKPDSKKPEKK